MRASLNVVELGPLFISRLNRMNPANTNGICKLEFVRPVAGSNINIPTAKPAKPTGLHSDAAEPWSDPDSKHETD